MTFTSRSALLIARPAQYYDFVKASITGATGRLSSMWKATGFPAAGATPATGDGAIPDNTTVGAFPIKAAGAGKVLQLAELRMAVANHTAGFRGGFILYDRLWHNSGFDSTLLTLQAITNPPVLTRPDANGGDDVELWAEIYTALGVTPQTCAVGYTSSDAAVLRTGNITFPASAAVNVMYPVELQTGDFGVKTVTGVQMVGSTGTAGNFGLTLMRRVAEVTTDAQMGEQDVADFLMTCLGRVYNNSCLAFAFFEGTSNSSVIQGVVEIPETA